MRKYDSKNKRNIGVIIGVCIIFAVIFSYFLIKEIKVSKIKYELLDGTILFDIDKNSILLNDVGTIKKKWNNSYYLSYLDDSYKMGEYVIAFNNKESSLSLYGKFYEVNKDSSVNVTDEETKLNNLNISRFYKIADRKYLITDSLIKTEDELLSTSNYLVIELDTRGNAIMYNNNVNVKAFGETKIITSNFTFDIANELLIYEEVTIDLKKIIGSTNLYKPILDIDASDNRDEEVTGGNTSGGNQTGNNTTGDNQTGGNTTGNNTTGGNQNIGQGNNNTGDIIIDNKENNSSDTITGNEIINSTSYTSIIRITPLINEIKVDYVIYDKLDEYLSVYVEVSSDNTSLNTIYLSKSNTSITLNNLSPGTLYNLSFKYTTMEDDAVKEEVIGVYEVSTNIPQVTLAVTKLTSKKINYKVNVSSYSIDSAVLKFYVNGEVTNREVSLSGSGEISGEFSLEGISIPNNSVVTLRLENIVISGVKVNRDVSWSSKMSLAKEDTPVSKPDPTPEESDDTVSDDNEEKVDNGGE